MNYYQHFVSMACDIHDQLVYWILTIYKTFYNLEFSYQPFSESL